MPFDDEKCLLATIFEQETTATTHRRYLLGDYSVPGTTTYEISGNSPMWEG